VQWDSACGRVRPCGSPRITRKLHGGIAESCTRKKPLVQGKTIVIKILSNRDFSRFCKEPDRAWNWAPLHCQKASAKTSPEWRRGRSPSASVVAQFAMSQKVSIARPVLRNRVIELPEHTAPEFHVVQVLLQLLEGLHVIANNRVFGLFRHTSWPSSRNGHFLLPTVKRPRAALFRECCAAACQHC
jgi:hypothetical protein